MSRHAQSIAGVRRIGSGVNSTKASHRLFPVSISSTAADPITFCLSLQPLFTPLSLHQRNFANTLALTYTTLVRAYFGAKEIDSKETYYSPRCLSAFELTWAEWSIIFGLHLDTSCRLAEHS